MKMDAPTSERCVYARKGKRYERICVDDLLWIEAAGSRSILVKEDENYEISTNLGKLQRQLPEDILVRVQRSYLVNINRIKAFDDAYLYLGVNGSDEVTIPIGKSYRKRLLSRLHRLKTE